MLYNLTGPDTLLHPDAPFGFRMYMSPDDLAKLELPRALEVTTRHTHRDHVEVTFIPRPEFLNEVDIGSPADVGAVVKIPVVRRDYEKETCDARGFSRMEMRVVLMPRHLMVSVGDEHIGSFHFRA